MRTSLPDRQFQSVEFRPERNATLDTLRWARRGFQIPTLLEVDITAVREAIREHRNSTGKGLSLTAWVLACVARAAVEHPRVHALRRGKRRVILFRDVDVAVLVEREIRSSSDGETLPMPMVVRNAHSKRPSEIHEEIQQAQQRDVADGSASIEGTVPPWVQALFFRLPAWLRDLLFWRRLLRNPFRVKQTMGTIVVTSTGMAAPGVLAWGIPVALHPLAVGIGGVAKRKVGEETREILALTVVFDHAVIDGAPVGRFIHRLHQIMTGPRWVQELELGSREV